ncbi:VCBS repeat-containing protein [Tellurirhabdus rosea]|uniref:VCBS repeat-containing protein n=1 Tax=Tellurirhabdus rosea TaxID=2674997 RepID=UPI002255E319|nr:VCBS repeat-containing protein [Tellurirhabdus rosea]
MFESITPETTGITFTNQLRETEQDNVLAFEYFYNGGGVAAGDFNNDGLTDLYFTGNQVDNALYLNQGELKFEDITAKAGVAGRRGGWKTGVTLADVNADGWLDIYVCYSGLKDESLRRNQLFINNKNLTFTDRAAEYGLADAGYSVQATFFDFDLDGDLDCFLINHGHRDNQRKEAAAFRNTRDANAGDKLFRNMMMEWRKGGRGGKEEEITASSPSSLFADISEQANIKGNPLGFGLGASVSDINSDGFPDIYVTNDYVEDDYFYINQQDGTFRDELRERVEHTSYSSMGVDVADLNNDNRPDIFTLDMLPESNARQKRLPWPDNWNVYQAQLQNGFWHQNMRNMLQIQQADGQFAEISQLAGVAATDWSWGTLLADFNGDGYKDIFVSNGMVRDFTDADFVKYSDDATASGQALSKLEQIRQMPSSQTKNYIFQNNRNLTFTNRQADWGFDQTTVSNGCAYADLDNDGDLDLITNNLNEPSRIYRNGSREQHERAYLTLRLKGPAANPFGIGAKVTVQTDSATQTQEYFPTRGFQSCSHGPLLFGVTGAATVTVRWPDGKTQTLTGVQPNQTLTLEHARSGAAQAGVAKPQPVLFSEEKALEFAHRMAPVNNFNQQILLPTHYSYTGPRMTVADVDGDGLEDVFVCGTPEQPGQLFLQKAGKFLPKPLPGLAKARNIDAVLADFNGDKKPDLYLVNGGYEVRDPAALQDQLFLNDGAGNFRPQALPVEADNGSCVTAFDADRDGDTDLFIGAHCKPFSYPAVHESFLLRNNGRGQFSRASLGKIGLVTDAAAVDTDRDGYPELLLAGEWMPITVLKNNRGTFATPDPQNLTPLNPGQPLTGWWNRLAAADLDQDGDLDLVAGNLGTNTQLRASAEEPASMVYGDFDQNGTVDFFMSHFVQGKAYPAYSRDEMAEQLTSLRKRFTSYAAFADATVNDCLPEETLNHAFQKSVTELRTLVLENQNGTFVPHELPVEAQYGPVYGILIADFDRNGTKDLLLTGNNSRMRLRIGKVDANFGVVLANRGAWKFEFSAPDRTGLFLRGDVRDVRKAGDFVLVGINDKPLRTFKLK